MPGPVIAKPTLPGWMDPAQASVFDVPGQGMLRKLVGMLGLDDPQQVMAFGTPLETGAATGGLLDAVAQKFPRFANAIKAYHGSPHDFEQFDVSKIGTGEGAQAYGHGLYFAENPQVAEEYRRSLSEGDLHVEYNGRVLPTQSTPQRMALIQMDTHGKDAAIASAQRWRDTLSTMPDPTAKYQVADQQRLIDWMQSIDPAKLTVKNPGATYEVAIGAHPDQFLDWDKPLSQQHPEVLNRVRQAVDARYGKGTLDTLAANGADPRDLVGNFDDLDTGGIERLLHRSGVPGIKYLDQGSRTAGEGSRNFVVFDDKTVAILRKYGILPPAVGAVLGANQSQDPHDR